MPMDRSRYPVDWEEISRQIRDQADHRCEFCGVADRAVIWRGSREPVSPEQLYLLQFVPAFAAEMVLIILTVAHLNHDPMDRDPANLRALCQRCHLNHDRAYHLQQRVRNRQRRQRAAGQRSMNGVR